MIEQPGRRIGQCGDATRAPRRGSKMDEDAPHTVRPCSFPICPSLSLHAINPPAGYAAPAITKFGKSSNTQLFFSVW
jgi:hypothetical protein